VETALERYRDSAPAVLTDRCLTAAAAAATTQEVDAVRLHSAAMHDTANVAGVTDAVLLFAPSEDGVSHSPQEWTDWGDCARATSVLAETVRSLATG
jgi:N-carbamoyl-L-amino-acid hydrolase